MINVIWHEGTDSLFGTDGTHGRKRYAATCMLNDMFDFYDCRHWIRPYDGMPNGDGAVVVFHGGHQKNQVNQINIDIAPYRWVVLIGAGDEESEFPYHQLRHPNMKLWIQSPIPGRHRADRFHLFGYMWDCHQYIVNVPKDIDWSFAGQVTHARRREMQMAVKNLPNGKFVATEGFGQGLGHKEYYELLSRSKVVLCPTGPACPDSFRFAEALEAGCVPIVDFFPSWKPDYPSGFWDMVIPNSPVPRVPVWSAFAVEIVLSEYDEIAERCSKWWTYYKSEYNRWLYQDIHDLGGQL